MQVTIKIPDAIVPFFQRAAAAIEMTDEEFVGEALGGLIDCIIGDARLVPKGDSHGWARRRWLTERDLHEVLRTYNRAEATPFTPNTTRN